VIEIERLRPFRSAAESCACYQHNPGQDCRTLCQVVGGNVSQVALSKNYYNCP
jgi:hypothetical protein